MLGVIISSIALLSIQSIGYCVAIVGGTDAEENSFPYQASIRVYGEHKCAGSLLNHRWIVSVAHCLVDDGLSNLIVVLGSNSLLHGGVAYNATRRLLHPDYVKGQHHDDLALLKLGAWVAYSPAVAPVKLPAVGSSDYSNPLATFTGWGSSQIGGPYSLTLKFIQLPVIDLDECRKTFPSVSLGNYICTSAGFGRGLCYGDGGGPLVDADKIIIGLGSWGSPCANGYPDVHTSVRSYISWIETSIADESY